MYLLVWKKPDIPKLCTNTYLLLKEKYELTLDIFATM